MAGRNCRESRLGVAAARRRRAPAAGTAPRIFLRPLPVPRVRSSRPLCNAASRPSRCHQTLDGRGVELGRHIDARVLTKRHPGCRNIILGSASVKGACDRPWAAAAAHPRARSRRSALRAAGGTEAETVTSPCSRALGHSQPSVWAGCSPAGARQWPRAWMSAGRSRDKRER